MMLAGPSVILPSLYRPSVDLSGRSMALTARTSYALKGASRTVALQDFHRGEAHIHPRIIEKCHHHRHDLVCLTWTQDEEDSCGAQRMNGSRSSAARRIASLAGPISPIISRAESVTRRTRVPRESSLPSRC
jgi:hypothetical protein